ncbi:MAG: hypothetical protein LGB71_07200 [Sulfurovum sp.]|nr:hypothetical protein [Sulfurovum sp.]MCB4775053.1 hypothetical protein [Sulfurovum sp.]MCB4775988.1 hypothetical protein [Sulfurovum sp.]MCB4777785.1 hypothetical protein [Sulfurovum sp.]
MYRLFLFTFLIPVVLFSAEFKRLGLNKISDIVVIEESYDMYSSKGKIARFYQEEPNSNLKYLFSLTLHDKTGTCSAQSIEEGSYEVNNTTLTLYTKWNRQGYTHDVPYGFRIVQYRLENNGTISRLNSKIYVETTKKSRHKNNAVYFLSTPPTTQKERKILSDYIQNVQKRFKGKFVQGKEADMLKKKVEAVLMRKMLKRWQ